MEEHDLLRLRLLRLRSATKLSHASEELPVQLPLTLLLRQSVELGAAEMRGSKAYLSVPFR